MPKDEDDANMRAQLAMMELETAELDDQGKVVDRPYEAYRLRISGLSFRQIAKRLGYNNEQAAHRAYKIYMEQNAVRLDQQRREEILNTSLTRLENLMHQHWNAALLGDIQSANVVLKCIDGINKLAGLYEAKDAAIEQKFVIIQRDSQQYVEQLREIALRDSKPKEINGEK